MCRDQLAEIAKEFGCESGFWRRLERVAVQKGLSEKAEEYALLFRKAWTKDMTTESLPEFRYHPDPIATGAIKPSENPCVACRRVRGYIYVGPVYAEEELNEQICPWCIADGRAHRDFDATFVDAVGVGGYGTWESIPDSIVSVLVERTPCFSGWQQEKWFTCCGDAAAFIERAGKRELESYGPGAVEAIRLESGYDGENWTSYLDALDADGSPTAYLFRCLHCGAIGGYSDCD